MQIIIVGCGNVGRTLAEQLSKEGHNITVVDERQEKVEYISNTYDIMGIIGNGASFETQMEAGVDEADLLIAVTGSDELNLLCCLIAKKAGNCHTIARVTNPVYSREINFINLFYFFWSPFYFIFSMTFMSFFLLTQGFGCCS